MAKNNLLLPKACGRARAIPRQSTKTRTFEVDQRLEFMIEGGVYIYFEGVFDRYSQFDARSMVLWGP